MKKNTDKTSLVLGSLVMILLFGAVVIGSLPSCNKDEQSRYEKLRLCSKTGAKVVEMERYIINNRESFNPLGNPKGYDELANYCANEVWKVLKTELKPSDGLTQEGEIAKFCNKYLDVWENKHPKHKSALRRMIRPAIHPDLYRICPDYGEKFIGSLWNYCDGTLTGSREWTQGTRDTIQENRIRDLWIYDPDVEWQVKDRILTYLTNYAQNPNKKAKPKREGFLNWGWFD